MHTQKVPPGPSPIPNDTSESLTVRIRAALGGSHPASRRPYLLLVPILLATALVVGIGLFAAGVLAAPGVPPVAIHPPRNAITATLSTTVSVTYDEPISETTVTSYTFAVHGMQSGLVTGTHGVVDGNTIIVTPTRSFHQGELVYAVATTRTLNLTGTGPLSGTQWQFNAGQVVSRCLMGFVTDAAASANPIDVYASSVAWGDYDSDGDLDVLLTGDDDAGNRRALLYENQAGVFITDTTASQNLTGVAYGSVAWGDYDNDGDLDILLTGLDDDNGFNALIYENRSGIFVTDTVASQSLTGVYYSSVAWGDYDNDGDLDILLTGTPGGFTGVAYVYENTGSGFSADTAASANLTGVYAGSVAWGDYDDDGDLDILLTGKDGASEHNALVYKNRAGIFITDTAASTNLIGVASSSVAWGDYDDDGDLDILLTGEDTSNNRHASIFENQAGVFVTDTVASQNLTGVYHGSVAWGDYDNDGDLDALLTGSPGASSPVAYVYENTASGFVTDTVASEKLTGVYRSSVAWGDYDDDGDLDILLTGWSDSLVPQAWIYRNEDCPVDLALIKVADPDPATAGRSLVYTLTVVNQGHVPMTPVLLSDTLPPSLTLHALDQTDDNWGTFRFPSGSHQNTVWDPGRPTTPEDDWLRLADPLTPTGVYTSSLLDAYNVVDWTELVWWPRRPYDKPLPDGGQTETFYDQGNANMTGNLLLLHLDEVAGATTFEDTSGLNQVASCPATPGEACPTAGGVGRFDGALAFDGAFSQTVVISETNEPVRYAIELWVRPALVTDTSFILRTEPLSGTRHHFSHLLGIQDGKFFHAVNDGTVRTAIGTTAVQTGTWYHLVGTAQSGGDLELYVDGQREARVGGISGLWTGGDRYHLGSSFGMTSTALYGPAYFSGELDEVAIFSRTLSSAEVSDHYLRGALRLGLQARACDDPTCSGVEFVGPSGLPGSIFTDQTDAAPDTAPTAALPGALSGHRYFQYRAFFVTEAPPYAPALHQVQVRPGHRAVTATQGSCVATGGRAFTCTLGTILPGQTVTVSAGASIHPSTLGVITNSASITATGDVTGTNNRVELTTTVEAEADLIILKHDDEEAWHGEPGWDVGGADPVNPGSPLTYTLRVRNGGPSTARWITVTDHLPGDLVGYPSGDPGWTCSPPGNVVTCTLDSLYPSYSWQELYDWEHIVVTATAPITSGVITNTAWVTSGTYETITDTQDNAISETTTIMPVADVSIAKLDSPDPVDPSATLVYTVTVTNHGPYTDVTGIVVTDTLPVGLEGHVVDGGAWSCGPSGDQLICDLLQPLTATASASFNVTVTAPLSGFLVNHVHVTADQYDPDEENNWDAAYTAVRPVADLSISKQDRPDPVDAGAPLTYTVVVTNAGPVAAGAYSTTLAVSNGHDFRIPVQEGQAAPYRTGLFLSSVPGLVQDLTITLHDFSHNFPSDLSLLLVGPDGRAVVLMANAGGGASVQDLTLTFNDAGVAVGEPLTSTAVYRPTNDGYATTFEPPAPAGPYGSSLSAFHNADPNGHWWLYVYDNVYSDGGSIGGWSLAVTAQTTDTVTLSDTLPADLTDFSVTPPPGWDCTTWAIPLVCQSDWLAVDVPTVFTLNATAPITAGIITNTAMITSTIADSRPGDNGATITTTVMGVADLSMTKQVVPAGQVTPGAPLTYTLTVSNAGPSPVPTTVTVTDVLPAGLTAVSASGTGWTCDTSTLPTVTCTADGLAVGAGPDILIAAHAPAALGWITNTAWCASATGDPDGTNNEASASIHVTRTAVASQIFMPLLMRNYAVAPDLVLENLIVTDDEIMVVIKNDGGAPIEPEFVNEFWVDVYIDPDPPPSGVNQTWDMLGDQGLVWGVLVEGLPLARGDLLTLTLDSPYYHADKSEITWPLPVGTEVWAQVDSSNAETDYGAVLENHEITGGTYNNIAGPVYVSNSVGHGTTRRKR